MSADPEVPFLLYGEMLAPLGRRLRIVREDRAGAAFIVFASDEADTTMLGPPEPFATLEEAVARYRAVEQDFVNEDLEVLYPEDSAA